MARQIVILERLDDPAGGIVFRYALWAPVPAARQAFYAAANPTAKSAVQAEKVASDGGATTTELSDVTAGRVLEKVDTAYFAAGTAIATIEAQLQQAAIDWQTKVATGFNPWQRYGTSWDGTTWTTKTVT